MGLTVLKAMNVPSNVEGTRKVILAAATGDAGDVFIGLNPRKPASIHVTKPTSGGSVFLTNTVFALDGSRITDPDHADLIWREVSTTTDEYFAGDERGLTAMKVTSDLDATGTDINISVTQVSAK